MKKKIFMILIIGLMISGTVGCRNHKDNTKNNKESTIKENQEDVLLTIKEGTLKNTKVTIVLENNSDEIVMYGNPYWIEKKENDKWNKVKTINDCNFTLPAYDLQPNEKKEIKVDWEFCYGKLPSGKYRIVKDVNFEYEDDTRDFFDIAVEFIIE